jgi:hypothetical protein
VARDFLLREGTDSKFGARHLKRSIERHLVFPLSNLLATGQIELGDFITVDREDESSKLTFMKSNHGALVGGAEAPAEAHAVATGAKAVARAIGRHAHATEGAKN